MSTVIDLVSCGDNGLVGVVAGRREARTERTHHQIRSTAMGLFLRDGFDAVTTTQIATEAGVAAATVFNYFDTKAAIYFGRVEPLETALIDLVESCPPGVSLWAALQAHVLTELTAGRVLHDLNAVAPFQCQIPDSYELQAFEHAMLDRREALLAQVLRHRMGSEGHGLLAELAAATYVGLQRWSASHMRSRLTLMPTRDALHATQNLIDQAFGMTSGGIGQITAP